MGDVRPRVAFAVVGVGFPEIDAVHVAVREPQRMMMRMIVCAILCRAANGYERVIGLPVGPMTGHIAGWWPALVRYSVNSLPSIFTTRPRSLFSAVTSANAILQNNSTPQIELPTA